MCCTSGILSAGFNWARSTGLAVRVLDIRAALDPGVHRQRIALRNPHARFARQGVLPAGNSYKGAPKLRSWIREGYFGDIAWFACERKILSQGVIRITIPHQDPPQVRVASEPDPHHVVDFPLVPISGFPNRRDTRSLGFLFRDVRFQTQVASMPIAVEVVYKREAWVLPVVIEACYVHQVIETEFVFGEA